MGKVRPTQHKQQSAAKLQPAADRLWQSKLIGLMRAGLYSVLFVWPLALKAAPLIVCAEDLHYYPHYDFTYQAGPSFARDLLQLFAKTNGIELKVKALPIKRIATDPECDLRYPDNPLWHAAAPDTLPVYFSQPLTQIMGATLVLPKNQQLQLADLQSVSVPRGFIPEHLLSVQSQYHFVLVETSDALGALQMVLKGRVQAADVEWNVAQYLLTKLGKPNALVIAKQLPFASVGFHLSSRQQGAVLQQFDVFMQQHQSEIKTLKQHYRLLELPRSAVQPIVPLK